MAWVHSNDTFALPLYIVFRTSNNNNNNIFSSPFCVSDRVHRYFCFGLRFPIQLLTLQSVGRDMYVGLSAAKIGPSGE